MNQAILLSKCSQPTCTCEIRDESFSDKLVNFMKKAFPRKSSSKIIVGAFDESQIRKLISKRQEFEEIMEVEFKEAWLAYLEFRQNFLGDYKSSNYKQLAQNLVIAFENQNYLISIKLHYVDAHIDKFPVNCVHQGEQQGELGYQDLKPVERRFQGNIHTSFIAD